MFGHRSWLRWSIVLFGCCVVASSAVGAPQNPHFITFPASTPGPSPLLRTNGLTVQIDATGCTGVGYVPVEIQIRANNTMLTPRRLAVRLRQESTNWGKPVEVTSTIEMPAGVNIVSQVLHLPQLVTGDHWDFDIWEGADPLLGLSGQFGDSSSLYGVSTVLWMGGDPGQSAQYGFCNRALRVRRASATGPYQPYDLPDASIDYSAWDIVLISLDELLHVVQSRPESWNALRQWVAVGGNLWIYDVGKSFGRLQEVDKLLDWPVAKTLLNEKAPVSTPGWRRAESLGSDTVEDFILQATTPPSGDPSLQATMEKQRPELRKRLQGATFVKRGLGLGCVVGLDTNDPAVEHEVYWNLLHFEFSGRYLWQDRHGVSFGEDNPNFWNFLIPGVGLAPIGAFECLITAFVVIIGPVNYFVLRRRHKQGLLMLTVPAAAGLVTGCLLIYAVLADGFEVRARARSFTEINQRNGDAVCWSRIAYYAGRAPSNGLDFPLDCAVYPIEATLDVAQTRLSNSREIEESSTRHFRRNWLRARTVTQLLMVRARTAHTRLDVLPTDTGLPKVNNRLGTRIKQLLVLTEDGKCGWAEEVPAAASSQLNKIEASAAAEKLSHLVFANQLEFPPSWTGSISGSSISSVFGIRRRGYWYGGGQSNRVIGMLSEVGLGAICELDELPPRSYVAIVERSPEFELGLDQADVEGSFHVILGHW